MVARSRTAKDSDLGASLFAGTKPMLATLPQGPPAPAAAAPVQNISGLFGGPVAPAGGAPAAGEYGSDEWALNTGGPGAMLWRALAQVGPYEAIEWSQNHPGALASNDTILKAAKKELT